MKNYTAFPFWRGFLQTQEILTANPFDREALGPTPVFLYSETTAPLPCAAMSGIWNAYADVRRLAAHLRFGLLPCHFGIWLCRDEWDPEYHRPCTIEDLCRGARAARNRYAADIPLMEEIAATLDRALAAATPAESWRHTGQACRQFNRRWKSTPSWNFVHLPLKDGKALLRDVAAKGQSGLLSAKLKAQLARPPLNENTQAALREILQAAVASEFHSTSRCRYSPMPRIARWHNTLLATATRLEALQCKCMCFQMILAGWLSNSKSPTLLMPMPLR